MIKGPTRQAIVAEDVFDQQGPARWRMIIRDRMGPAWETKTIDFGRDSESPEGVGTKDAFPHDPADRSANPARLRGNPCRRVPLVAAKKKAAKKRAAKKTTKKAAKKKKK